MARKIFMRKTDKLIQHKYMNTRIIVIFFVWLISAAGYAQVPFVIDSGELKRDVSFLASDSLKGRKPGTPEIAVAARYIQQSFVNSGLKLLDDQGFQYFDIVTGVLLGDANALQIGDQSFDINVDFAPLAFSSGGAVSTGVVVAGYGFDLELDSMKWNDYQDIDAGGKWVMIFRGDPEPDESESVFIPYSGLRSKILTAKDKQAAGVLVVSPGHIQKTDAPMEMVAENNEVTAGIPVISITREVADKILQPTGWTVDSLDAAIREQKRPISLDPQVLISAQVDLHLQQARTANVVALLESSDPDLRDEYIVVGAHYDHLGMGGPNSGSRMPDTSAIHNGADDNASGTAMVMALAKLFSAQRENLGRSIIFVAFSAEEMGLIGSKYFIDHPPVPLQSVKAMFNFDMVGRFDPSRNAISVSGTGTSIEADSILKTLEGGLPFAVTHSPDGYGPSDHAPFYAANIPVFYFNTGVHTDYHTPFDDVEFLDFSTSARLGDLAAEVIRVVDGMPKSLTFMESGSKTSSGRMGRSLKVTLGIMPDFAGSEKKGLRVDGVTKGKPADLGGMLKGDIIISINGLKVDNIYEYMSRLSKLKHGQTVIVEVLRNEEKTVLLIQL